MKYLVIFLAAVFFVSGCSVQVNQPGPEQIVNLVSDAAKGIASANDSLGGIINASKPLQKVYVDTLSANGIKFFGVAAQYNDPEFNRFALYDQNLNLILLDKSLNGDFQLSSVEKGDFKYFNLQEKFYTNDSIQLRRISIYRGDTSGFSLAFRTFVFMKTRDTVFIQNLYEIERDIIRTNISAPLFSGLNNITEDYFYNRDKKIYDVRRSIYFDDFVTDIVNSTVDNQNKFYSSFKIKPDRDFTSVFELTSGSTPEYYLTLNEDWKELRNKPGSAFLKKDLTGSKYINERLGSNIYVFKIPFYEDAEDYITVTLTNQVDGNYTVRYSEEIKSSEFIKKYLEYSCKTKKYLMILSAAKDTYTDYKQQYFEIINTFYINC
jgi:hypothetical protein